MVNHGLKRSKIDRQNMYTKTRTRKYILHIYALKVKPNINGDSVDALFGLKDKYSHENG